MTDHLSLCADRGYVVPLAVTLASIALRHGACDVSVVHDGFDTSLRRRIEGDLGSVLSLEWIDFPTASVAGVQMPSYLSTASAGRLLLPDLLPERQRTIYLDCDVLCLDHLGELSATALGPHVVGAVRDGLTPFAAGPLGTDWWGLGLPADAPYLNAGVLVMDLDSFRSEGLGHQAVQLMTTCRLRWADQCALNTVLQTRWRELPRRWNVQTADVVGTSLTWALWPEETAEAVDQPAILHFTERDKPWHLGSSHPARHLWRDMQQLTSWPRWSTQPKTRWQRLRRRLSNEQVTVPRPVLAPEKESHGTR